MPNVVLEAVSCGLPVVATNCGGIPEVIDRPEMGILMNERSALGVAEAVRELVSRRPVRMQTRLASLQFGWRETIKNQALVYQRVCWGA
jgi:glycosyltransferase involved in cell wall biosynthesis